MTARRPQAPVTFEDFFEEHAVSVGTVELLMLLYDEPADAKDLDRICATLHCPRSWAELQVDALREAGLVQGTPDTGYAYRPATPSRAKAIDALAREWRRDRVLVSRRIFSASRSRRRSPR